MKTVLIIVAIATLQNSDARVAKRAPNQKAVMSALQNVFSQGNTDRAMQMMQMAKRRTLLDELPCAMKLPVNSLYNPQIQECQCQRIEPIPNLQCGICANRPEKIEVISSVPLKPEIVATVPINRPDVTNLPCKRTEIVNLPLSRPEVIHVPVPYPVPVRESCPQSAMPLVSPFLPSASPISAWAPPTSSLLPPVIPSQTRNHFLRKIPIPPPCI